MVYDNSQVFELAVLQLQAKTQAVGKAQPVERECHCGEYHYGYGYHDVHLYQLYWHNVLHVHVHAQLIVDDLEMYWNPLARKEMTSTCPIIKIQF